MPLDSDVVNGDSQLHVEFFLSDAKGWEGKPFVRIVIPGDKNTIIEQPVRDDHKARFPRQWLYFQMKQNEHDTAPIGTSLEQWMADDPENLSRGWIEELHILKFVTVEQVATASDLQLQKVGMGGVGLREKAKNYLAQKNRSETANELENTKKQLAELQAQMASLLADKPRRGRPPKVQPEG